MTGAFSFQDELGLKPSQIPNSAEATANRRTPISPRLPVYTEPKDIESPSSFIPRSVHGPVKQLFNRGLIQQWLLGGNVGLFSLILGLRGDAADLTLTASSLFFVQ